MQNNAEICNQLKAGSSHDLLSNQ